MEDKEKSESTAYKVRHFAANKDAIQQFAASSLQSAVGSRQSAVVNRQLAVSLLLRGVISQK